jgi:hypothetical protein
LSGTGREGGYYLAPSPLLLGTAHSAMYVGPWQEYQLAKKFSESRMLSSGSSPVSASGGGTGGGGGGGGGGGVGGPGRMDRANSAPEERMRSHLEHSLVSRTAASGTAGSAVALWCCGCCCALPPGPRCGWECRQPVPSPPPLPPSSPHPAHPAMHGRVVPAAGFLACWCEDIALALSLCVPCQGGRSWCVMGPRVHRAVRGVGGVGYSFCLLTVTPHPHADHPLRWPRPPSLSAAASSTGPASRCLCEHGSGCLCDRGRKPPPHPHPSPSGPKSAADPVPPLGGGGGRVQ